VLAGVLERFGVFLDRPLDPSACRAILALAAAILLGLATLFALGAGESGHRTAPRPNAAILPAPHSTPVPPAPGHVPPRRGARQRRARRQDPQDERGSAAAERAAGTLRSHRALQHVPYRRGGLRVELAGARGRRALLRVSAPTVGAAQLGWRGFLRRFHDSGHSYLPVFEASGRRRGGA
jgi:hypothetical protein